MIKTIIELQQTVIRQQQHNIRRAAGEINAIVTLLMEHPERHGRKVREWCQDVTDLGWVELGEY